MATKTAAKKTAPKKAAAPKKESAPRGFQGKRIKKLVKDWPNRVGTKIHASWALITSNMTYDSYVEAGGRYIDVVDMIKQGIIEVV